MGIARFPSHSIASATGCQGGQRVLPCCRSRADAGARLRTARIRRATERLPPRRQTGWPASRHRRRRRASARARRNRSLHEIEPHVGAWERLLHPDDCVTGWCTPGSVRPPRGDAVPCQRETRRHVQTYSGVRLFSSVPGDHDAPSVEPHRLAGMEMRCEAVVRHWTGSEQDCEAGPGTDVAGAHPGSW